MATAAVGRKHIISAAKGVFLLFGVDRAIALGLVSRGWSALAGPFTLWLIANCLTPAEQGYYYTFASLLGMTVFFELGLTHVILQFASHERSQLRWSPEGTLWGTPVAKARLASLLRDSLTWYCIVAVLAAAMLLPAGLWFLRDTAPLQVSWQMPWICVTTFTAATLCLAPVWAVLEGCGLIVAVNRARLVSQVTGSVLLWLALIGKWGLFAAVMAKVASLVYGSYWLYRHQRRALIDLLSFRHEGARVHWWKEVWPMQWRIAISWMSGWCIFQLFTPVMFHYHGAAAAGQMGMSMTLAQSFLPLSFVWINTKSSLFGQLISARKYYELDAVFFRAFWQSAAIPIIGGILLASTVSLLCLSGHPLSHRFIHPVAFAMLTIAVATNHLTFAQACYLRAHKREPFMIVSLLFAVGMIVSAPPLANYFGATGMAAGYLLLQLTIPVAGGSWIFFVKRRAWHGADGSLA
jgi:hypothetical protein